MPVVGSTEQWAMSCGLNLASCRHRAEALARQLHVGLWAGSRSNDGSPGSASPCFGFPPAAAIVLDKPSKLNGENFHMSSLDEDDCSLLAPLDIVVTPPVHMSPPYSPVESIGAVTMSRSSGDQDLYGSCRDDRQPWIPDSPPESFGSGSIQSDSPALTIETEERSTTSNSAETVSELASPTFDVSEIDKGSALADELCTRLRQFQSTQVNGISVASPQEEPSTEADTISSSTTLSDTSSKQDSDYLSPEACPRLVRSTSLKTGKTPPDTPNRKKIVRFADALGLDLEAVRHFVEDDDAPLVPQSAFADLKISPPNGPLAWAALPAVGNASCHFVPQFKQPAADVRFLQRVRMQKVCLENVIVSDLRLTAIVRVLNLGFEKQVRARYTTTEWAAHTDLVTDYVPRSCDGFSDKFSFTIHIPHMCPGQRLVFALKYLANGQEFWDNNNGDNYVLRCQTKPTEPDAVGGGSRWLHHFM